MPAKMAHDWTVRASHEAAASCRPGMMLSLVVHEGRLQTV